MIENRRSYRLPFRRKFIFATKDRVLTGNSSNISAGGIFITTLESGKLTRDSVCRCLFLLNPDEEPLCMNGTIRRVVAQSMNPEETPGVGFSFDNSESDTQRLSEFMETNRKNFEVASTILSGGEPDLNSLEPLLKQMHLPPLSDLGELRFYVERILKAIELVGKQ